jgi:four helix bundle protein
MADGRWQMADGRWQMADGRWLYLAVSELLQEPGLRLSPGFRHQLDRAALSVCNNIAEGFERATTAELQSFIAIARGSAGEVRSMMEMIVDHPKLQREAVALNNIRGLAESCARQLTGWSGSIGRFEFEGRRHLTEDRREARSAAAKAREFRVNFLRRLKPEHPLYRTSEARAARGEVVE